jgi:hypothetical protein
VAGHNKKVMPLPTGGRRKRTANNLTAEGCNMAIWWISRLHLQTVFCHDFGYPWLPQDTFGDASAIPEYTFVTYVYI